MPRYLFAFFSATLLYSALIASIFYVMQDDKKVSKSDQLSEAKRVAIAMIGQECHHEKKKIEEKVEKKLEKKSVEKPMPKVEPTPIVKEVAQVFQTPQEVKEIKEASSKEEESQEEALETFKEQQKQKLIVAKQQELDRFTKYLINKINENKRYPMSARRRAIEGEVRVKFVVLANGGVNNIEVLEGKTIFHRSTTEAIEKKFSSASTKLTA
ncbi:MAG: TonB family protein [Epsilonproteobacteria bacterium]|nr:TonB family protein [Campylobacterota bacterium]